MVLLPDAATASYVLKDSNMFDSLGLTLSSVSASVLWMSSETAPPMEPSVKYENLSKGDRLLNFTGTTHVCSVISEEQALHDKISEPTTASTSISSRTSFRSIFQTSSAIASPRNRPLEMNVELSEPEKQLACAGTASTSSEISEEAPQDTIAEPTTTSARIDPRTDLRRGNTQKLMFSLNAKTSLEEAASIHAILEENGIFLESVFFPLRNVEVSGTEKRSARAGTTSTCSDIREEEAAQDKIAEPVMSLATMDPRIALRRGSDQKLASVNLRTAVKEAASHAHLIVNDPSNHCILEDAADDLVQVFLLLPSGLQKRVIREVEKSVDSRLFDDIREQAKRRDCSPRRVSPGDIYIDVPNTCQHGQAQVTPVNTQRESAAKETKGRLWKILLCSVIASGLRHVMLFVLSKKLPRSEGKEGKEKAANLSKDRIIWAIQKIVVPVSLCFIMSLLRVYVISAEEIQVPPQYTNNAVANLVLNSASKIIFFSIKEFPTISDLYVWAHLASFVVDLFSAFFLWRRRGYHDPDVPDG